MDEFQPGDLVRYREPTGARRWFEAQLVQRQGLRRVGASGRDGASGDWLAVVTDTGTFFAVEGAAEVLGQTVPLSGDNLRLVRRGIRWRGRAIVTAAAVSGCLVLREFGAFEGGRVSWMLAIAVLASGGLVLLLGRRR